jgi:hypothetical protein
MFKYIFKVDELLCVGLGGDRYTCTVSVGFPPRTNLEKQEVL